MFYRAYQAHTDLLEPLRLITGTFSAFFKDPFPAAGDIGKSVHDTLTAYELLSRAHLTHRRPSFGIERVMVGNREVAVEEEAVLAVVGGAPPDTAALAEAGAKPSQGVDSRASPAVSPRRKMAVPGLGWAAPSSITTGRSP